ncbi:Dipeptidyl aminopeptidase/acylaminoacyl peptidase [Amycolatopsis xylanica]|uniref:Dipeptidyl aminopeptidase/acylaminoacyl peptidase n=1 Tax=Amycolatopsis xylanica TaxID=589385 RepID=A0A1H3H0M7_9PSEU|nr:serine hydrolase [Amycolatopsis xylanica]SDY08937.1 Dipeptidyl aminopeptidase/acylaminoacyl peptidase [Amycolatopsis xylanica]
MTRRLTTDDLYALAFPQQPAIAPDGSRVVYVLRTADREADATVHTLWQVGIDGGDAVRLTTGKADLAPAFSPDGAKIAFLREGNVWLLPASSGEPEQLTKLPLGAGTPVWSPDGTKIAFTAPIDLAAAEGEDDAARERRASAPVVVEKLGFKADGAGLVRTIRTHLHVVDVASGDVRQVTEGDWHASDPAWSPDGKRLAFAASMDDDADLTFRSAAYVVAADGSDDPRLIGSGTGQCGVVSWTADGAALLVVGARTTETGHTELLRVPLDGGEAVSVTAPLDRNLMPGGPGYPGALPRALEDGSVLFCVRDRGHTHLYTTTDAAPRRILGDATTSVSGLDTAGTTAVAVLATPESYGEIVAVDLTDRTITLLTSHGSAPEGVELFVPQEREFAISDGTTVHGWLVRDPSIEGPQPLLLDIHGGPHNAWSGVADAIHLYHQELAARGWAVLLLNPRGSDGYGESFFTGAVGQWGTADVKDFLEPLDDLVAEGVADPKRLTVSGYSYGGYMTCYLTSRDNRFAAAVAGGVVSDLTSVAGTSDFGRFMAVTEIGANPWEDRELYRRSSPFDGVEQVRTPTLIVQGEEDHRCPVGQAEQWFAALRERDVPTELVRYPGGSHLFILDGRPSHRIDFNRRIAEWVQRYAVAPGATVRRPIDAAHWQRRLTALARKHGVPGAALGIQRDGEPICLSTGVLNTATGVEATPDSVFQIGSISKVWTSTVAMQLVDEGLIGLDAPIVDVLPELRLADPDVTKQVTLRHLLTHTSGIDGDVFTDTGRGDDCLEKFVELLEDTAQMHPLGATFSYCNSGFVLMGRLIEKLTGKTWDQAMSERIFAPLGMKSATTLPEEALMFRAAMGHVKVDGEIRPGPAWGLPRSVGPAGLITASVQDVLAFARLHLNGGKAPDGTQVLSEDSVALMIEKQVELPDKHSIGDSWGLGWIRFDWGGEPLYGHDGNTIGQSAFLRILPSQGLAVTLLTNGEGASDLYRELYGEIFAELAGVTMPAQLEPPVTPSTVDSSRHFGVYERASVTLEVYPEGDVVRMRRTATGPLAALVPDPVVVTDLVPVSDGLYVTREPGTRSWMPVVFYALPTGEPYVHLGVRATPKVA